MVRKLSKLQKKRTLQNSQIEGQMKRAKNKRKNVTECQLPLQKKKGSPIKETINLKSKQHRQKRATDTIKWCDENNPYGVSFFEAFSLSVKTSVWHKWWKSLKVEEKEKYFGCEIERHQDITKSQMLFSKDKTNLSCTRSYF